MVYTEKDINVRQEQCRDWMREAEDFRIAQDGLAQPERSRMTVLSVLSTLFLSLRTWLLSFVMHMRRHRSDYQQAHFR